MMEIRNEQKITNQMLCDYMVHLYHEEKSEATRNKYKRDIQKFMRFAKEEPVSKDLVIAYKDYLKQSYEPTSANSMLAAMNSFFVYIGWNDCRVKRLKIQRKVFCDKEQELSKAEYISLLKASKAPEQRRINRIIQTIGSTGIRVSELKWITVEAIREGQAVVESKGKVRIVFIPQKLQKMLRKYINSQGIEKGPVFVTRTGRPMDRSNIWRDMKALCKAAGVDAKKVFPHNLRHLFARTFYDLDKDIAKLADILGHSNIETTRIYVISSGMDHSKRVERLGLVV